jgi:hypothetical protein
MALTVLAACGVYRTTVCPTVSFTDSGELATVATTLGIAHPTGYPIWTLIGRIVAMLPLGAEEIVRLNALSGFITALAVGLFFKLVLVIFRSPKVFGFTNEARIRLPGPVSLSFASSTALVFGFSSTVWAQSVEVEVYALHLFLILAASFLFVGGMEEELSGPGRISQRLLLFSFVLGLSFANHMTTVLLAPAFLYLFFASIGFNRRSRRVIVALVPCFLLGLSAYIYLPLRSASGPAMDWGHPLTLQRLWWHITGKQYQTWMFGGWEVIRKQLTYFVTNFPTEFQWVPIVVLFYGVMEALSLSRRLVTFLAILLIACLVYSINYEINEIDPYFIVAYIACGGLIAVGMHQFLRRTWSRRSRTLKVMAILILISLPIAQVLNNMRDVDQSRNYQAENFVKNVFSEVEPNAVIFSSLWDYFVSPAYYVQIVRKERPDVVIIDRDLLQNRTWYYIQLSRRNPRILEKSKDKVDVFLLELNKFEQSQAFSYPTIKGRWDTLLHDLIDKLTVEHPIYVDPRVAGEFPEDFAGVPEGLLIRLVRAGEKAAWRPITMDFTQGTFSNYVTSDLKRYLVSMYAFHAVWLSDNGRKSEARESLEKGLRVDPAFLPALRLRAQLGK